MNKRAHTPVPNVTGQRDVVAPWKAFEPPLAPPTPVLRKRPSKIATLLKKASFTTRSSLDVSKQTSPSLEAHEEVELQEVPPIPDRYLLHDEVYSESLEELVCAINHAEGITEFELPGKGKIKSMFKSTSNAVDDVSDDYDEYYRCDVHGVDGADYAATEMECKKLVSEVGGKVLDDYEYVGGFLYTLPAYINCGWPLNDNDETAQGGYISVSHWTPFNKPRFDGLRMNPPNHFAVQPSKLKDYRPKVTPRKPIRKPPPPPIPDKALPDLPEEVEISPAKLRMQHWVLQQREKANQAQYEANAPGFDGVDSNNDDVDLALSPRILDPGVELAILDPKVIRSSLTPGQLTSWGPGLRASWAEKEVHVADDDPVELDAWEDVHSDAGSDKFTTYSGVEATAVGVDLAKHVRVRGFGEEMKRMENMYRNWVPEMSRRFRR